MTPSQEKYLKQRLDQVIQEKTRDLVSRMTAEEREAEFAAGRYNIIKDGFYGRYEVVFPRDQELQANYEEVRKKLCTEKTKILDQVMLGGQADLEKMFEDLKNIKV
jgi:hypothetical protein